MKSVRLRFTTDVMLLLALAVSGPLPVATSPALSAPPSAPASTSKRAPSAPSAPSAPPRPATPIPPFTCDAGVRACCVRTPCPGAAACESGEECVAPESPILWTLWMGCCLPLEADSPAQSGGFPSWAFAVIAVAFVVVAAMGNALYFYVRRNKNREAQSYQTAPSPRVAFDAPPSSNEEMAAKVTPQVPEAVAESASPNNVHVTPGAPDVPL
eukprot:TRINITY_DN11597_c1_g1_i1.p1 TRINITY_DN11597_c1_g1~~TRINITY_DN11597_c1_g1_i1.p1  ORF type:complete len:213 (+),score=3.48 TRINITY_DN11597_c1_g1_i1:45-683(+)